MAGRHVAEEYVDVARGGWERWVFRHDIERRGGTADETPVLLVVDEGVDGARPHFRIELQIGVSGKGGGRPAPVGNVVQEVVQFRHHASPGQIRMVADIPVPVEQRGAADRVKIDWQAKQPDERLAFAQPGQRKLGEEAGASPCKRDQPGSGAEDCAGRKEGK